jgi:hypothetical protein
MIDNKGRSEVITEKQKKKTKIKAKILTNGPAKYKCKMQTKKHIMETI